MKRKLITITTLLMTVGLLFGFGSHVNKIERVSAASVSNSRSNGPRHEIPYDDMKGTIFLELQSDIWKTPDSQIALYFTDSNSSEYWGELIAAPQGTSKYVEYSYYYVGFIPTKCIAFSFTSDVDYTMLDLDYDGWVWDDYEGLSNDPFILSKTQEIKFDNVVTLGDYSSGKWANSGSYTLANQVDFRFNYTDVWEEYEREYLTMVTVNDSDHLELFINVNLLNGGYFLVALSNIGWYTSYEAHPSVAGNFTNSEGGDRAIHNTLAGSYTIYFDFVSHGIYISSPALEAADAFGELFLDRTSSYCSSDVSASVQTELKNKYDALYNTAGAQEAFYGATVIRGKDQTYPCAASEAISRYVNMQEAKGYSDFLGLGDYNPKNSLPLNTILSGSYGPIAAIIIISSFSVAVLGIIVLQRKKHN